jgi:hypothetical protein
MPIFERKCEVNKAGETLTKKSGAVTISKRTTPLGGL